jgi:hypothetical protein
MSVLTQPGGDWRLKAPVCLMFLFFFDAKHLFWQTVAQAMGRYKRLLGKCNSCISDRLEKTFIAKEKEKEKKKRKKKKLRRAD